MHLFTTKWQISLPWPFIYSTCEFCRLPFYVYTWSLKKGIKGYYREYPHPMLTPGVWAANRPILIHQNSDLAPRLKGIKQMKLIIHPSTLMQFLLFYFPKIRNQFRILIYRNWTICWPVKIGKTVLLTCFDIICTGDKHQFCLCGEKKLCHTSGYHNGTVMDILLCKGRNDIDSGKAN